MTPHWNNPREGAVPVPIEELVECINGLGTSCKDLSTGESFAMTKEFMLAHWGRYGTKLDAYILPNYIGFCIGVRYGNEDQEYLSPFGDQKKVEALYNKYKVETP